MLKIHQFGKAFSKQSVSCPLVRHLHFEPLEDRRLLANVTVSNLNDVVNGTTSSIANLIANNGGDGISLREAILAANADNTDPADTINFAPSVTGTIQLTNVGHAGEIVINSNLTINGPGAELLTIRAFAGTTALGDGARIFNIQIPILTRNVAINGLTLTGGDVGSTYGGGAILSFANLTITGSTISGNSASDSGGGITNRGGSLSIVGSTISGNSSNNLGGGVYSNLGSFNISQSTVSGNTANLSSGGGIFIRSSTSTIDSSTISVNSAGGAGGIGIEHTGPSTNTTLTNSTISGNSASGSGGGVAALSGTVNVRHSTITANRADSDSNATGSGGGVSGNVTIDHTIVAGNLRSTSNRDDISGSITARYSLIGDNTGATITNNGGNQIGTSAAQVDARLFVLRDNGGPSPTHSFLAGSPAIDTGDPAFSPPPTNDQRGTTFGRVADGNGIGGARIDIGAYEQQNTTPVSFVVDTLVDEDDDNFAPGDLSLREAIALANTALGADTISFSSALTSGGPASINLTILGHLAITDSLTIEGPDANLLTIRGFDPDGGGTNDGDGSRVLNIDDGNPATLIDVEIVGLTLRGGDASGSGGAIFTAENLTVASSIITGNATSFNGSNAGGGGIFSNAGSVAPNSLTVRDSTISYNRAFTDGGGEGGGIYKAYGSLVIERSTIARNSAASGIQGAGIGGGIRTLNVTLDIRDSTIATNSADGWGGGIGISGGIATITNSTISGNHAETGATSISGGRGGGIGAGGNLTIRHSTITNNHASTLSPFAFIKPTGGGLSGQATLEHTIVAGNSVGPGGSGPDVSGVVSARYSLFGNSMDATIMDNGGSLIGTDAFPINPQLAGLADNGGPTRTRALLASSPAINAGDPNAVPGIGGVPRFDQRGYAYSRIIGGRIDIGAFEFGAVSADFDNDGGIDGRDFLSWQRGFGKLNATKADGDANGDNLINGTDLGIWQSQYDTPPLVETLMESEEFGSSLSQGVNLAILLYPNVVEDEKDFAPLAMDLAMEQIMRIDWKPLAATAKGLRP